jgi:hypothetical protein
VRVAEADAGDMSERDDEAGRERFKHLPERVKPEDMVTTQPVSDAPDPEGGRDTDRDFMIRYSGS